MTAFMLGRCEVSVHSSFSSDHLADGSRSSEVGKKAVEVGVVLVLHNGVPIGRRHVVRWVAPRLP